MASPGTPLSTKLGVLPGRRFVLVDARGWTPPELPAGALLVDGLPAALERGDVVLAFVRSAAEYTDVLPALAEAIRPDATLWIAWPRKAGGHASDLGDTVVRDAALPLGIVDTKVARIDDDWSALRFVWRRPARP